MTSFASCRALQGRGHCLALGVGDRELSPSLHKEVFPADFGFAELEPALPGGQGPLTEGVRADTVG